MFNWNFEQMVLTDVNDNDREVEVEYTVDPGQAGNGPIFDKNTSDLIDPGEPYYPPSVDDVKIYDGDVDVTDQFDYDWDQILL